MDRLKDLFARFMNTKFMKLIMRGIKIFGENNMSVFAGYGTLFIVTSLFPLIMLIIYGVIVAYTTIIEHKGAIILSYFSVRIFAKKVAADLTVINRFAIVISISGYVERKSLSPQPRIIMIM